MDVRRYRIIARILTIMSCVAVIITMIRQDDTIDYDGMASGTDIEFANETKDIVFVTNEGLMGFKVKNTRFYKTDNEDRNLSIKYHSDKHQDYADVHVSDDYISELQTKHYKTFGKNLQWSGDNRQSDHRE